MNHYLVQLKTMKYRGNRVDHPEYTCESLTALLIIMSYSTYDKNYPTKSSFTYNDYLFEDYDLVYFHSNKLLTRMSMEKIKSLTWKFDGASSPEKFVNNVTKVEQGNMHFNAFRYSNQMGREYVKKYMRCTDGNLEYTRQLGLMKDW